MGAESWRGVVEETQEYYDGPADEIYRDIWGENIHMGLFDSPGESLQSAMERTTDVVTGGAGLKADHFVIDAGCGYGALARHIARRFGCRVLGTNISEREIGRARALTREAGLADRVSFERADFHELPYEEGTFDRYFSQEAFLHAADKKRVLKEAHRVLKAGGRLAFTDLLVRRGTPQEDRERIFERVKSPDMWDLPDYDEALQGVSFRILQKEDWSEHVPLSYAWVRGELERRRPEFEERIGGELVDKTSAALQFWVDSAKADKIGWAYFLAEK